MKKAAVVRLLCALAIGAVGVVGVQPAWAAIPCPAGAPPGTVFDGSVSVAAGSPCVLHRVKILGNLVVAPGASATLTNSDVAFKVTVAEGASLVMEDSKVGAGVVGTNSATVELVSVGVGKAVRLVGSTADVRICDSVIPHWVIISGSGAEAAIVVGDTKPSGCLGNNVGGQIQVSGNAAPATIRRNTAKGIQVLDNTSTSPTVISANTVDTIACSGNAVDPVGGNNIAPVMTGQCADL